MKPLLCFFISCWLVATGAYAADRYDRNIICKDLSPSANCALHIEQAIAKDVPGVIQRTGLVLTIKAKNGSQIKRKNSPPFTDGGTSVYVCYYLPEHKILQLCHYLNETLQTEYFHIENGNSVTAGGFPTYSPSKHRAVLAGRYYEQLGSIVIFRFEKKSLVREFEYIASPNKESYSVGEASWFGEDKIVFGPYVGTKSSLVIERTKNGWEMRAP